MTTNKPLRQHNLIPIYVVENHNEVLPFIYRNIGSRHLPFQNNLLIHFDSHPDLSIPRQMSTKIVNDKYELFENISIENWILPAAFSGYIKHIVWVKPHWSHQIPSGQHEFAIGEDTSGHVSVNSPLDYFVSEGVYRSELLKETQNIKLDVFTMREDTPVPEMTQSIENNYILDIDLDFFSTHNPFKLMYSKGDAYEKLKDIFTYNKPENSIPAYVTETVRERNELLDELEKLFGYLETHRNLDDWPDKLSSNYKKVSRFVNDTLKHYNNEDIDWTIMFNAGCTWDDPEALLPHHETSDLELKHMYIAFEKFLRCLSSAPTIITISRSSDDDYCPKHQVEQIQEVVLNILTKVFKVDKPILQYLCS